MSAEEKVKAVLQRLFDDENTFKGLQVSNITDIINSLGFGNATDIFDYLNDMGYIKNAMLGNVKMGQNDLGTISLKGIELIIPGWIDNATKNLVMNVGLTGYKGEIGELLEPKMDNLPTVADFIRQLEKDQWIKTVEKVFPYNKTNIELDTRGIEYYNDKKGGFN